MADLIPNFRPTGPTPTVALPDGHAIPALGFGVWQVPADDTRRAVEVALGAGYRAIDTAAAYGNEAGVGAAIADSALPREELYVTTKLWNNDQGYDQALRAFDASADALGLEYVDLYLIHWPQAPRGLFVDTFRAMQKLRDDGRIRSIGVSNFTPASLDTLIAETGEIPAINQIELHPRFTQPELRAYHAERGIATEAWSPLGQGKNLDDPVIGRIADEHGKTPAQVIIRWHLQLGNVVIPKSVTPERIASNAEVFDFELTDAQQAEITGLDSGPRLGPDPDQFVS